MKSSIILAVVLFVAYNQEAHCASIKEVAKDVAKTIGKTAVDSADAVSEVPQTGGVIQKVLHKTASLVLDKGVDVMASKYPVLAVAAPHIKKLAKPAMNMAHEKINNLVTGDKDEPITVAPKEAEQPATQPLTTEAAKNQDEKKTGVMEKLKDMVGAGDGKKEAEAPAEAPKEAKKSEEKPAMMDKLKDLVGVGSAKKDEKAAEGKPKDEKSGLVEKVKDLVGAGEDKKAVEEKPEAEEKKA